MKSRESELLYVFLILDLLILVFCIFFVGNINPTVDVLDFQHFSYYLLHGIFSWVVTYFMLSKKNLFLRDGFFNRFQRITQRVAVFVVVSLVFAYLVMPRTYSRIFLLEYTFAFYLGKLFFYYGLYLYLKYKRSKGDHVNRALIIGVNDTSMLLKQLINSNPMLGYKFYGFLDEGRIDEGVIGTPDRLEALIKELNIEIVFITVSFFNESHRNKELLFLCNRMGVRLRFVPEHQQWFKNRINMESIERLVLINPQEVPLDDIESRLTKRVFDIVFSSLVIIFITSWLFPILAVLIKLGSKGPVFFVQKRTGINNREFKCLKFRSMKPNESADEKQATAGDDRITKIGLFMRRTNIDEMPQFFNVLFGQMSVVGPRPHMLKHTEQYSKLIEHYLIRHYVKPGLTGWAQINGYRGETDELWKMEKRVEYDMDYINSWTFGWDVEIIFRTVFDRKGYHNAG